MGGVADEQNGSGSGSGMVVFEEGQEEQPPQQEEEQEDLFVSGPPVSAPEGEEVAFGEGEDGGEEGEVGANATSFIPGLGEALGIQGMGDGEEVVGEEGDNVGEGGGDGEGEGGEGAPVVEEDEDADMEEVS